MKAEIIAEIGSNWEGSLVKARKIILECMKAGTDAVKFQMWRAEDLYSRNHSNWDIIKKSQVTFEKARRIKEICDDIGIEFFCSAFYPEAVSFLETLNVKRYKVASRTCLFKDSYSYETLLSKSRTRKPVIISMGMGGNKKKIKKLFKRNKTVFCYCISEYPLKFEKINWKEAIMYDGFSDHTLGITAPIIFSVLKNKLNSKHIIIEKHVKLRNSKGPDASSSIDTTELSELINHIHLIEKSKF